MFSKNLKYNRLKCGLSKKELAIAAGLTPMAISNYENLNRIPKIDIMKRLAEALHISVSDFAASRNGDLVFCHNGFRKSELLGQEKQAQVRETAEEYFDRFMTVVEILGGKVLSGSPSVHSLVISGDIEQDALALRKSLNFSPEGPIGELVSQLENKGILMYACKTSDSNFTGTTGAVNGRPFIVFNSSLSAVRIRSTVVRELSHMLFNWDHVKMSEKKIEQYAAGVSSAFLLPKTDLERKLGHKRSAFSYDMISVASEYGVSVIELLKRARQCSVLSDSKYYRCHALATANGWKQNDPPSVFETGPLLFSQLVYRAVAEEEISVQRGAELLQVPYKTVASNCFIAQA